MNKRVIAEKQKGVIPIVILCLAFSIGILGYWSLTKKGATEEVPDYLKGHWSTTTPSYEDKSFKISKVTLVIAPGSDSITVFFISKITKIVNEGREVFTIECKDIEGDEHFFFIVYLPDNGGTLFFKNQPKVKWTKET